jgi:Spy/CpxP family protein refolding chaperone
MNSRSTEMKKKILIGSVAFMCVLVTAFTIATAQGMKNGVCDGTGPKFGMDGCGMRGFPQGDMGMHRNPYNMLKKHAKELGLTNDQLNEIKLKSISTEKATIELRSKLETLHVDMKAEMDNDKPSRSTIYKLLDEINSKEGELKKARITLFLDIKDILTPEQEAKVKELCEPNRNEMKERRQNRFAEDPEPEDF